MTLAEGWRDYVLLDAGDGEKFEIWGGVKVVRPDPQAFWPRAYEWERPDMHYHRSRSGGGTWEMLSANIPATWQISYEGLRFVVRPTGFKHMGLFPEQAANWRWMQSKLREAVNSPMKGVKGALSPCGGIGGSAPKVLNLFAYTGGATVACLSAGASVTHVDAAKGMNAQARENVAISGLSGARILTDDVLKFVRREIRRGNMYEGIVMDPPVFGRGPGGEMWRLEEGLFELVENCIRLLSADARFFLLNAYTAGFSPSAFGNVLEMAARRHLSREFSVSVGEIGIGAKSGVLLPCGMYARLEISRGA